MNKQSASFFNYLVVVVFAGCIVALGAAELHAKYGRGRLGSPRKVANSGQMAQDLRGDSGSFNSVSRKATPVKDSFVSKASPQAPAKKENTPEEPSESEEQSDSLGWSDRRELNSLIDNLSP